MPTTRPAIGATNEKVQALIDEVLPLLAQADPATQGACLAEFTAMWLATHETEHARDVLLTLHIDQVMTLLPTRVADLRRRHDVH